MSSWRRCCVWLTACTVIASLLSAGAALAAAPAPAPATPQTQGTADDSEEKIDQRLQFLMDQLASVEASINEINKALLIAGAQKAANKSKAEASVKGNALMDRHAGGPVPWQEFYGRKPGKFFFHGRRVITTYGGGAVIRHSTPTHTPNRPPQFDYIYKANKDVEKRAAQEIAALGKKEDVLLKRRQELEADQIVLWCKIALRAVTVQELAAQPLYRFEPKAERSGPASQAHVDAVQASIAFLREANRLALAAPKEIEANPARTFSTMEQSIASSHDDLAQRLLDQAALAEELADPSKSLGKMKALTQKLEDAATNAADAYQQAQKYDKAKDEQQKYAMRAKFQEAMFRYAEILLDADDCAAEMAEQWHVVPDASMAVAHSRRPQATVSPAPAATPTGTAAEDDPSAALLEGAVTYHGHLYKFFASKAGWKKAAAACEAMGGRLACAETQEEQEFLAKLKGGRVVWVGGFRNKGKMVWLTGKPIPADRFPVLPKADATAKKEHWDFVALGSAGNLRHVPEHNIAPALSKREIQGYICEWDAKDAVTAGSREPASNAQEGGSRGKGHKT